MNYHIHIAFGFHVNCYHSYRGDTDDAQGFGSDLRIIRKIIRTLDALNADGIPVKGTWDCDNCYSLERILPAYAPDILEGMQRRVKENGDEAIIMGYSNGALGAMQPDELSASVELAVSNPQGSGLADLFCAHERIVRPQEVMFSPSQIRTYKRLGVDALCLYYSCVPFDSFRTLIPPLDDEEAFNPLTFSYQGDSITVLPTYSNADVCDAGCLRAWVKMLRKKQESGEIKSDLLLFINMDADAIFWETLDLPLIGNRLANTDGIHGLVTETADLDYVRFDTPGKYLRTHAPVGTIRFTQDTADGNFTGYASWAEKPYNRKIWTAVERSRTAALYRPDEANFLNRVRLLSTTHFGLATPVLNLQRKKAADALAAQLTKAFDDPEGELTIHNTTGSPLQCLQLKCHGGNDISVAADGLESYTVLPMGGDSVFLMLRFRGSRANYKITAERSKTPVKHVDGFYALESAGIRMTFGSDKRVSSLTYRGYTIGLHDFLRSYLIYDGKRYDFLTDSLLSGVLTGGKYVRLKGRILLPNALRQGEFVFTFFTSEAAEGIFVYTDVQYPYTAERDAISTENSNLGRYTDMKWQEAAPFCLSFLNAADVSVIKRNFEGDVSRFRVASFAEADQKNRTLDSFNNQLTAGTVGLTDGQKGLLIGNARNVLSSMAYCPMRLEDSGRVRMNPFGTFSGSQRHHMNRSGDRIPLTYTLIAPQGKSLAPSYNGCRERAVLCLLPFTGDMPDDSRLRSLLAFADGAYATGSDAFLSPYTDDNVRLHGADASGKERIRSPLLTGVKGNLVKYLVRGTRAIAYIAKKQLLSK